jgi:hypothetical protein
LQQAGVTDCYRAFAKLFSWPEQKYHPFKPDADKICTDMKGRKNLGLEVSDTTCKIKLVELFENDSSNQNDHAEIKRHFIV